MKPGKKGKWEVGKKTISSHLAFELSQKTLSLQVEKLFGNLLIYRIPFKDYKEPRLIAGIDGVGTKLDVARILNDWSQIGQDAVAMVVNDIVRFGARPIFFLPYIGRGEIDDQKLEIIMRGIVRACQESDCSILGGETATMFDFYKKSNQHEVAGCGVGICEKSKIITGKNIKEGDVILGLLSSGLHSNGFMTIREILESKPDFGRENKKLILKGTKIYVKPILKLASQVKVSAVAHITGGGLSKKLGGMMPKSFCAYLSKDSWSKPEIYKLIHKINLISEGEMFSGFNMGIGMAVILKKRDVKKALKILKKEGEKVFEIGYIGKNEKERLILE